MYGRLPLKVPVTLLYPTSVLPTNAYWEAVCICQMGYVSLEALASHLHPDLCTPAQSAKPLGKGVGVENAQAFLEEAVTEGEGHLQLSLQSHPGPERGQQFSPIARTGA